MNQLLARIQKEFSNLQKQVHQETNDVLERVRTLKLTKNLEKKREELEKLLERKIKRLEPLYRNFKTELQKHASKAGLDLDKIEKNLVSRAKTVKKKIAKPTSKMTRTKMTTKVAKATTSAATKTTATKTTAKKKAPAKKKTSAS